MNVLSFWRKNRGIALKIWLYHMFFVPLQAFVCVRTCAPMRETIVKQTK